MDGRKSTDREPRQGNLLGKTSSSTQAVDPFSVDRSLPLLFRSFSPALSLSLALLPASPHLPRHLLLIRCSFLSSASFVHFFLPLRLSSLYLAPYIPASPATLCLSPSFASFAFSRSPCARGIRLPLFLAAPSTRLYPLASLSPLPPLSKLLPFTFGRHFDPYLPSSPLLVQLCSSNYISRLPPEYLSLSLLGFFLSFLPSFLPSSPYLHIHTYILHTLEIV